AIAGATDSLSPAPVAPKPLAPEPDTSTRMFIKMYHDVKLYREKMQGRCDSLYFSEVDSVAKLYTSPILWESIRNQLTSDIMMFVLVDGNLDRGSMSQNAMIISQEDENYYNQIKSTEMTGFFKENALSRYDALGGVNALFFLKEQNVVTTLNSKEAQFMMVTMENGTARRLKYYESPKSDAYPVAQLDLDKQRVKGFVWRGDERPQSRYELTNGKVRKSERARYESMHKPTFPITDRYFDGYMTEVYREIERVEQLRRYQKFQRDSTARAEADSTAFEIALEEDIATIESQFQDDDKALQNSLAAFGREKNPFKQEVQKESETGLQEGTTVTKSKKEIREERRQKRKQMRQARRQARKEAREARKLTE
ncbi:MAG: hypothetical protein HUJ90_07675, partial [Bacteroidales bacterium]|nr:hypothetical protein [Bacteroidales bacterium]